MFVENSDEIELEKFRDMYLYLLRYFSYDSDLALTSSLIKYLEGEIIYEDEKYVQFDNVIADSMLKLLQKHYTFDESKILFTQLDIVEYHMVKICKNLIARLHTTLEALAKS